MAELNFYEHKVFNQLRRPPEKAIPRHYNICIFKNVFLTSLYLFEHKVINWLWRPPHLEQPKTLQHKFALTIY